MTGIAAISRNRVIGRDGKIPWYSKDDFKHFKELTWGKKIIVGRKTFSTLPLLKNRELYVLTNNIKLLEYKPYFNFFQITENEFTNDFKDAFLCGGREVYYFYLSKCSELYLTEFDFEIEEAGEIVKFPYSNLDLGAMFNRREEFKKIKDGRIWKYTK